MADFSLRQSRCLFTRAVFVIGVLLVISCLLLQMFPFKPSRLAIQSLPTEFLTPAHTKEPSWDYCSRRIEENIRGVFPGRRPEHNSSRFDDNRVMKTFSRLQCDQVIAIFTHAQPTTMENEFPLAYILQLYKGAALFVKQLQFIYMPQNIYCIHVDKSASFSFFTAVEQIVRCLPNVFVTKKRVKVIYLHVSTVQAQLNCMEDLFESTVPWHYVLNLCGQDFPLYTNKGIVQALQALKGKTNAESCEVMKNEIRLRTSNVFKLKQVSGLSEHQAYNWVYTNATKTPPPHGIIVRKGSSLISGTREFCKYATFNKTARAFLEWLNDTIFADESFFPSLYQHPGVPGGLAGKQPEFITRAVQWYTPGKQNICHGYWLRGICVLGLGDLSWLLGAKLKNKIFAQKIDFNYDKELVDCLYIAVKNRTEHPYHKNGISWDGPCPN